MGKKSWSYYDDYYYSSYYLKDEDKKEKNDYGYSYYSSYSLKEKLYKTKIGKKEIIAGPISRIEDEVIESKDTIIIDLTKYITDMSNNIEEYLIPIATILDALESDEIKAIAFGCTGGCGRTSTVLLSVVGIYTKGNIEKVKEVLKEFKKTRSCGPETEGQKRIVVSAILSARKYNSPEDVLKKTIEIYEKNRNANLCSTLGRWMKAVTKLLNINCADQEFSSVYNKLFS